MFKLAVILADIRSLHNVGSILRSADGFGVSHIYYAGYTPYPIQPNDSRLPHESRKLTAQIHKTALGAEMLPATVFANPLEAIATAKAAGYQIVALEQSEQTVNLQDFALTQNTALLLGNEVTGIPNEQLLTADVILEIPMFGQKESFNVSVAAGIALYQIRCGVSS
jgi:23S rRNA (guanosine2251-2'-O)-methyltransferase